MKGLLGDASGGIDDEMLDSTCCGKGGRTPVVSEPNGWVGCDVAEATVEDTEWLDGIIWLCFALIYWTIDGESTRMVEAERCRCRKGVNSKR
jgi:hypothetical protein